MVGRPCQQEVKVERAGWESVEVLEVTDRELKGQEAVVSLEWASLETDSSAMVRFHGWPCSEGEVKEQRGQGGQCCSPPGRRERNLRRQVLESSLCGESGRTSDMSWGKWGSPQDLEPQRHRQSYQMVGLKQPRRHRGP